jgi:hypothetical protein
VFVEKIESAEFIEANTVLDFCKSMIAGFNQKILDQCIMQFSDYASCGPTSNHWQDSLGLRAGRDGCANLPVSGLVSVKIILIGPLPC